MERPPQKAQNALARGLSFLETISSGGSLAKYLKSPTQPRQLQIETMPPSRPHTPKTKAVESERSRKARKKVKRQGRIKTPHGLIAIQSDSESELEDESSSLVLNSPKPKSSEVVALIEETAKVLEALGDAQDVEACLTEEGNMSEERLKELQEQCSTIANLIAAKIVPTPVSSSVASVTSSIPTTFASYDDFFVYKAPSKYLYVLKPVEVFKGNARFSDVKVLGFIRRKGGFPLVYALPGWSQCTDGHPRMLDSVQWAKFVKHFTDFHGYEFGRKVWDVIHHKEHGHTYRCHVELRLMLWFACRVLVKAQPSLESSKWKVKLGHLHQLKYLVENVEAEIVLSKAPCKSCRRFKKWFERYTGLNFTYVTCSTLEMECDPEVEISEEAMIQQEVQFREDGQETRFEVVLRRHSTPPEPKSSDRVSRVTQDSSSIAEFKLSGYAKRQQKNRSHEITPATPPTRKTKLGPFVVDASDSETDDYQPSSQTARKSRASSFIPETPSKKATRGVCSSLEESDEFGNGNLERIQKERREKRKRERDASSYPSPPSGKRARHSSSSETLYGS